MSVESKAAEGAAAEVMAEEKDPSIETYPVTVETAQGDVRPMLYVTL
ncbi:MAG: hypothetical protein R3D25_10260 [Geminicoccaceae bacterium]